MGRIHFLQVLLGIALLPGVRNDLARWSLSTAATVSVAHLPLVHRCVFQCESSSAIAICAVLDVRDLSCSCNCAAATAAVTAISKSVVMLRYPALVHMLLLPSSRLKNYGTDSNYIRDIKKATWSIPKVLGSVPSRYHSRVSKLREN